MCHINSDWKLVRTYGQGFCMYLLMENSLAQTLQKCVVLAKHLNIILVFLNKHAIQFSDTASMNKKCVINTAAPLKFYFIKSSRDWIYTFLNKSSVFLYNN